MKPFLKTTKADFPGPAPRFDCLEATKNWIGGCQWDDVAEWLRTCHCTICVQEGLREFGLVGYPVEVAYDHFHGEGSYLKELPEDTRLHEERARETYAMGVKAATEALARGGEFPAVVYTGNYEEEFQAGMQSVLDKSTQH